MSAKDNPTLTIRSECIDSEGRFRTDFTGRGKDISHALLPGAGSARARGGAGGRGPGPGTRLLHGGGRGLGLRQVDPADLRGEPGPPDLGLDRKAHV